MVDFHKALKYIALACAAFMVYLVLSYFYPKFFQFEIVQVFHEMLTIPAMLLSVVFFVYSAIVMFIPKHRRSVLPVFLNSLFNVFVVAALWFFGDRFR